MHLLIYLVVNQEVLDILVSLGMPVFHHQFTPAMPHLGVEQTHTQTSPLRSLHFCTIDQKLTKEIT